MQDNRQQLSRNVEFALFALTATVFGVIALVALITTGQDDVRNAAIAAALFASASQFVGSNTMGRRALFITSIALGWASLGSGLVSLILLLV